MEEISTRIACGLTHTIATNSEGKVFAWGDSRFGQLGNERERAQITPVCVDSGFENDGSDSLVGKSVMQTACGAHHTVLLAADGTVYSFGKRDNGRLGVGDEASFRSPIHGGKRSGFVPILVKYFLGIVYDEATRLESHVKRPRSISFIACGSDHTLGVDEAGRVYALSLIHI